MELAVNASSLFHGVLHAFDISDLRSDVEMEQLELAIQFGLLKDSHALQ